MMLPEKQGDDGSTGYTRNRHISKRWIEGTVDKDGNTQQEESNTNRPNRIPAEDDLAHGHRASLGLVTQASRLEFRELGYKNCPQNTEMSSEGRGSRVRADLVSSISLLCGPFFPTTWIAYQWRPFQIPQVGVALHQEVLKLAPTVLPHIVNLAMAYWNKPHEDGSRF